MPVLKNTIPTPGFLHRLLQKIRGAFHRPAAKEHTAGPRIPNLEGDRDIEWSWGSAQMPGGPSRVLDFGTGESNLAFHAALRGFEVTSIDLGPPFGMISSPARDRNVERFPPDRWKANQI
jgi:2-polyprenyl-3-methyl-5-hydroxy-6-metoxy-1,4-benzoquinol methylase